MNVTAQLETLAAKSNLNVTFDNVTFDTSAAFMGPDADTLKAMLEEAGWSVMGPFDDDPFYLTGVSRY